MLPDELGGLDRAITYAKSTYTESETVAIEHWPKNLFSIENLPEMLLSGSKYADISSCLHCQPSEETLNISNVELILASFIQSKFTDKPYFLLAMDEKTAFELISMGE